MTAFSLPAGEVLPLSRRLTGAGDPLALYHRLSDGGRTPHTLLLESADATTGAGERSVLMVQAALRVRCLGLTVRVEALTANGRALLPWLAGRLASRAAVVAEADTLAATFPDPRHQDLDEASRGRAASPLDVLRVLATEVSLPSRPADLNHLLAGILSYDLVDLFEPLPPAAADPVQFPRYDFWMPEQVIILDHLRNATTLVALVVGGDDAEKRYHDATVAVTSLAGELGGAEERQRRRAGGETDHGEAGPVSVDVDDAEFAELVTRLKRHIHAGDVFQIVPSRTFSVACPDTLTAYGRLRRSNPSPYMFHVVAPEYTLFGASPETSVKVGGRPRTVMIRPIAGTVRRGRAADGSVDPDLDARLEAALRTDTKEVAEHLMLVDLARNDVARVSRPGTRALVKLLAVERYSHVMHLVSEVTGELQPDLDALHAYTASMNMGTLVGAPKVRAAQLLRGAEATARGPYGGAIGYLTDSGEFDSAIIIRSALVRDGVAQVRAGAGVVFDSDPAAEAQETRQKAAAVLRAITGREVT